MGTSTEEKRMTRRTLAALSAAATLGVVALAGCGSSGGSSSTSATAGSTTAATEPKPTTSVQVVLDWVPNPDHLALYETQAKGYFEQAGLKVKLQPPSNVADVAKLVATGKTPLGISYEPDTIIAGASNLPVTAVAALVPTALNSLIAPAKSGIKAAGDLRGKSVGTPGIPSDDVFLKAIAKQNGFKTSDIKKVNVGAGLLPAVISGKVDAIIGGYRNIEAIQVKDRGLNPTVIPVTEAGVPHYDELVVLANSDKLKSDAKYRATVKAFLSALAKGNADAIADPTGAADSMKSVIKGYPKAQAAKMVAATAPLLNNPKGFGQMDPAAWQGFADWMTSNGMIDKKVDTSTLATNDYLPQG
jgi:putative hydroxymethylpyrimidine transport system substrate-binding protein